ncbi:hypothetical protein [Dyadobacter psychrophilus]|uniref:GAF domain-containing protein n=1 Tax=Dyadobacter psychrophilus TaxID=651661 RepID=A0A1T5GAI4_9BACT|nr:hypothetical protein [Dyadobacter psychrophilus]SKC05405.1 hypothetical protein SAMN05660293_03858 [Dyadobacter psychrophilus]
MKPLNLLIVAIQKEYLALLEDSLGYAGYKFSIRQVASKQSAIEAFYESKYDLLISNCLLPDGKITDLANVLGSQLPCLVMTEGHCPVTAERVLAVTETSYYINCSNKLGWIPALENTLAKWKNNARKKIAQHNQNHESLYKKVLARCEDELAANSLSNAFSLLLEVMDLSRIYLYIKNQPATGDAQDLTLKIEITAPGVPAKHTAKTIKSPAFNRWNALFDAKKPVLEPSANMTGAEIQWFGQQDAQSMLAVPVQGNMGWTGFIGLDDTLNNREWTQAEIALIESVATLIQKKNATSGQTSRNSKFLTSLA